MSLLGVTFLLVSLLSSSLLFALTKSAYDQNTAIRNLYFAYGAYCPESQLKSWTCKWCKEVPNFEVYSVAESHDLTEGQAFTGYDATNKQIVVSFRGSSNLENWLSDFTYFQVRYPWVAGGYVHEGFYKAWNSLSAYIQPDAEHLMDQYPGTPVLVTGHSLGAALAQYAALNFSRYAQSKGNSASVTTSVTTYTYGSPRWGNAPVVQYFGSRIALNWRMVNVHDVVPTVPPKKGPGITSPYQHTPIEIWYTSDSPLKYTQCNGSGEDPKCEYLLPSAEDHLMYMDIHESCK